MESRHGSEAGLWLSRWRWLIWAVPLGLVTSTFALSWHLDPDFWRSPASLMRLAQEAVQQGDQPRALELARKAVSREPGNADYSLSLGQICLEAGQPQETLDLIRRLDPPEAKIPRGLKLQAQALDRLGDRQAALKLLAGGLQETSRGRRIAGGRRRPGGPGEL